jgi:putative intracellular protease/amidase
MGFACGATAAASPAAALSPQVCLVAFLTVDRVKFHSFAARYVELPLVGLSVIPLTKACKQVAAVQGLKVQVDHSFASSPAANIVVVPGGHIHDAEKDAATLDWIRKQAGPADHVLSVCTGSFILGSTGLLDGKPATTFHRSFEGMQKQFPKVHVVTDQRWVDSGELVTSAGLASGIDAALHVVAEVRGLAVARSVAMNLEYDWKPEHGFVRGKMADRYLRLPAKLRMPEGTRLSSVISMGDTRTWDMEYSVETRLTPEEFFAFVADHARKDPALAVDDSVGPRQVAWEYPGDSGGRWRVAFNVTDARTGAFSLVGKLTALP